jgi:hypothetical protein
MAAYLATADLAAASRTLAEWRQIDPNSGEAARLGSELERRLADREGTPPSAPAEKSMLGSDRKLRIDTQPQPPAPIMPFGAGQVRQRRAV